jgi:hypothetical protein
MSEKPEALRLAEELNVASLKIRGCLEALSADALLRQHAEIERLRGLLLDIRKDEQTSHWHRDIDAAVDASKEPATEPAIRARGEVPR